MRLTVSKSTYGSYKRPVIYLNYHNGGTIPTYEIIGNDVNIDVLKRIQIASQHGLEIEYKGFDEQEEKQKGRE